MESFPFTFGEPDQSSTFMPLREIQPGGYKVLPSFEKELPRLYNLELRPEDVWLVGLQKSGTTWATEMVWTTYHQGDVKTAKEKGHYERWITAEENMYILDVHKPDQVSEEQRAKMPEAFKRDNIKALNEWESPRFIRSHLPLSLLPPKLLDTCKVVYIIRDFRDCFVSMHKVAASRFAETPPFETFARSYLNGNGYLYPWTSAIKEAWEKRSHKNMFLVFYDEMKKDLPGVLRRLASFLGKELSDEQLAALTDHLSLDSMRANDSINMKNIYKGSTLKSPEFQLIGKGLVGGWVKHFSPELAKEFEEWWTKNMADSDFKFPE